MAFPTTRWTLLAQATLHGDPAGRQALARMCEGYRRPVMAFLAARGHAEHEAEDLAQDFFLKLLEERVWKRADKARGKFRSFMLAVLNHLLLHRLRDDGRQKRGGGAAVESLDWLEESGFEVAEQMPGAAVFDQEWALKLVREAVEAVEEDYTRRQAAAEFAVLRRFLPGPVPPPTSEAAAAELGMSEVALRSAVSRLRQHFREVLRRAVARTVNAPHEVDEELRYLATLLMKPDASLPQHGPNGKESAR